MTAPTATNEGPEPERVLTAQQTRQFAESIQGEPDLGDSGKKALAEERAARKAAEKSAADIQKQLDALTRANESALEKAQREAAESVKLAESATAEALRWRIAAKHGISDEDADTFLTGTDEASLTKQAQRLSNLNNPGSSATAPGPRPDLTQGGKNSPVQGGPAQDFAAFLQNAMTK